MTFNENLRSVDNNEWVLNVSNFKCKRAMNCAAIDVYFANEMCMSIFRFGSN